VFDLLLDSPAPGTARLRLTGHLDDAAARVLLHAAADVARSGCTRLVVDLDGLSSWDETAAYAVVGCTRLARWLEDGVGVVASGATGRALAASAGVLTEPQAPSWPVQAPGAAPHLARA